MNHLAVDLYSLLPRPLTLAEHAKERMASRRILPAEVLRVVRVGNRIDEGACSVHYDLRARIKVVVNWDEMMVVTVVRLSDKQCRKLQQVQP